MRTRRRRADARVAADVPTITSARRALREDVDRRTHRYLLSMSIRTACLLLAVFIEGPLRWIFLAGAIVLPYVAVVLANAGREPDRAPDSLLLEPPEAEPTQIAAGPEVPTDDDGR